ncbi:nucleotidyltransferase domain-containing protein [Paenibacillus alkalitolerans]|uniref:nucleotidyltransferase domain-containing protein n=1 Tax=Paenibacillus alkalitolerans TaxID=2799335 RepID=UPI001F2F3F55|nr:nucleotidyltransferase family protein [Paenibacillus alkalitolerans]
MENDHTLDVSSFPKELNVMLAFMQTDAGSRERYPVKQPLPDIDWNQFLKLVRHHRVYPQVYTNMQNSKLIPADVLQALSMDYGKNTIQMLRLSVEMERLCRSLQENGVSPLVLKGPVLAKELYGDLSLRTSKDLDILIPMADIEKAEEILTSLGYACENNVPRVFNWKWKKHHISYFHPQTKIEVEIHWRLNSDMGKEPPFEELWERRRTSSLTSYPVYLPGSEDLFIYLVSHGARHAWFRLRWLADIDCIARQNMNWDALIRLMRRYQCLHLGGQALLLASRLLNTPVPDSMKQIISDKRQRELAQRSILFIRDTVIPTSKDMEKDYKRYLFALKTTREKMFFLISQLYPSFRDAEALPLPKTLHFLYFPLRPFVWLWRQMRQQA